MKNSKQKKIVFILIGYLFITIYFSIKNVTFYRNIINPFFWGLCFTYFLWNQKNTYIRFYRKGKQIINMVIICSIYLVFYFYLGFLFGFSKSPYRHDILFLLKNIIIEILPVISIEMIRGMLVMKIRKNKTQYVCNILLFILLELNYYTILSLWSNKEELFQYTCSIILPLVACNLVCTYLSCQYSFLLSIIYRSLKKIAIILLPILPNINWFACGCIDLIFPTLVYVFYEYHFMKERKKAKKKPKSFLLFLLCISFVCFMLGIFPYEPIAILSNSMTPTFSRGDVLIFKKLKEEELTEIERNTIIVYQIGNQNVAHRIINKVEKNKETFYQTKGDKNNVEDRNLVGTNQIKGVYVFSIKYAGFPSVWLYEYFHKE